MLHCKTFPCRSAPAPLWNGKQSQIDKKPKLHLLHSAQMPDIFWPGRYPQEALKEMSESKHPWKDWVKFEVTEPQGKFSASFVRRLVGMGTWLLNGMMDVEFEFMESEIEGLWRQLLADSEFALKPMDTRFKMIDSLDKYGEKGEGFTRETDNPEKGEEGYPRMFLENRMYTSKKFQKLHMGLGVRQDGVQFLHCVMLPRVEYQLPIFSVFMMVELDQTLSELFHEGMRLLQLESISSNRPHLDWTREISSPMMISMAPKNDEESSQFLIYSSLLCKVYLKTAEILDPISSAEEIGEIQRAHDRFLEKNNKNKHLRESIEKSFGADMTDEYLKDCFFARS